MSLELAVWREACRHIEIEESLSRMASLLALEFPIDLVALRLLERGSSRLQTVASLSPGGTLGAGLGRTELRAGDLAQVDRFLGERRARVVAGDPFGALAVPSDVTTIGRDLLVGPLSGTEGHEGLLVFVSRTGTSFTPAHVELMQRLLEPFAVALDNDQRFHELARLREAAEADARALRSRLHGPSAMDPIVGATGGLRPVMTRVDQVAATDVPVLILGETGSGKEIIARAIHEKSRRAPGPVVRVNCGAIPAELIDSELFGHEKGSFTGAHGVRKGWFERADGGTLFLDEIGELSLAAQVRLLRILQDGTLERVGGQRSLHVDVRIVAATHRDLPAMVADGRFRADLWYRISVFPLRLPALRERMEDLSELVAHFTKKAGQRLGYEGLTASEADLRVLAAYSWPGNVRELASVIERAAILGHGARLEIAAALGATRPALVAAPVPDAPSTPGPVLVELDTAMVHHIEKALEQTGGRIEGPYGAAALLNINPHTLRARMRKLGIEWARYRRPPTPVWRGALSS